MVFGFGFFPGTAVTKGSPAGKADSGIFDYKEAVPWADVAESDTLVEETRHDKVNIST